MDRNCGKCIRWVVTARCSADEELPPGDSLPVQFLERATGDLARQPLNRFQALRLQELLNRVPVSYTKEPWATSLHNLIRIEIN